MRRLAIRKLYRLAANYEQLRLISDNFGMGPLLRYGEDRWGDGLGDNLGDKTVRIVTSPNPKT